MEMKEESKRAEKRKERIYSRRDKVNWNNGLRGVKERFFVLFLYNGMEGVHEDRIERKKEEQNSVKKSGNLIRRGGQKRKAVLRYRQEG